MRSVNRLPNITDYDILLLKVFDIVVKCGSFASAEVCLNKSKSAISVYISSLESRLGQKLCRRGRSGFSLTPEGAQVYEICKDLFADLDRFRDRISRATSQVGGTLLVAIEDGLLGREDDLVGALSSFKAACSDVFLVIYATSAERVRQMLLETTVDIGICSQPADVLGTEIFPLCEQRFGLYCGQSHPLFELNDDKITVEMLADCELVDSGLGWASDNEATAAMPIQAKAGQASAQLLLVLTGKMISYLPQDFAQEWVEAGRIRPIQADHFRATRTYHAMIRSEISSSKVCNRMLREFEKALSVPRQLQNPVVPQQKQVSELRMAV